LAIVDRRNTGKVIAWIGSAMFAAFAIGAPVGSALYAGYGIVAIALVTALAPLATLPLIAPLPAVVPVLRARISFAKVFGQVWVPGFGSALGSVGFGAVTTFAALLFADRGWTRVFFSHAADRFGGAKVALFCVLIETAGQALMWLAVRPELALLGAALTGFGFSLVYPGFGVEAVRRVPAQSRGLAMGAYTAFLDLAQGFASPALGLVAKAAGLNVVFLVSAITVLCAALVASWLIAYPVTIGGDPQ
jgi:predicted MFS family arabinose efflux permease